MFLQQLSQELPGPLGCLRWQCPPRGPRGHWPKQIELNAIEQTVPVHQHLLSTRNRDAVLLSHPLRRTVRLGRIPPCSCLPAILEEAADARSLPAVGWTTSSPRTPRDQTSIGGLPARGFARRLRTPHATLHGLDASPLVRQRPSCQTTGARDRGHSTHYYEHSVVRLYCYQRMHMALGYRTPWEVYSARRRPRAK